jgi:hypothetical protein
MDTPTISCHDDGDAATILPIETGQSGLHETLRSRDGDRAVGEV